jgi:transglutaminase-like putative cysteine protease
MRIHVSHRTSYRYETPAKGVIQLVRKTPRSHEGQHVLRWRIDVSEDCQLFPYNDAFGNIAYSFTINRPVSQLDIAVEGELETREMHGVVSGAVERFPPQLYLRETLLTAPDPAIVDFAEKAMAGAGDVLGSLHALQTALHRTLNFDVSATEPTTSAAQAFGRGRGVCQDYAHIFIAAARHRGIPARYIGGHLLREGESADQEAGHAWAEAYVPDLGWVAFDPTNGICATEAYVRIAMGLDYQGAAPIRGTVYGMARETMSVSVHVDQQLGQRQN